MADRTRAGSGEAVQTEVKDFVGILSLNRPKRHNAFDNRLSRQFLEAVEWAEDTSDVRVILLRGEGPSFSSGRDTAQLGRRAEGESHFAYLRRSQALNLRLAECPKPVLAALKGHVLGKGLETALAADMRVVARGTRLGFPEIGFGLVTDNGGAARATALIGPARAKYLLMSGESINAEQAVAWGLADWLVEPEQLDEYAFDLARRMAASAPLALGAAKELVDEVYRGAVFNGTRIEALAQIALFATDDYREARAAKSEGRPPSFTAR